MNFFGMDHKDVDWDHVEFVYVEFEPYVPVKRDEGYWNPNFQGVFRWGAKGVGFGEIAVYKMSSTDSTPYFETENMSKRFIKQMMNYWIEQSILDKDNTEKKPEFRKEYCSEEPISE